MKNTTPMVTQTSRGAAPYSAKVSPHFKSNNHRPLTSKRHSYASCWQRDLTAAKDRIECEVMERAPRTPEIKTDAVKVKRVLEHPGIIAVAPLELGAPVTVLPGMSSGIKLNI